MIRATVQYFASIPAVVIDGALYVGVSVLTFLNLQFGSDDSAKWIDAATLFWLKLIIGALAAGLLSLKMFRSTGYADHQRDKKGDTQPPFRP